MKKEICDKIADDFKSRLFAGLNSLTPLFLSFPHLFLNPSFLNVIFSSMKIETWNEWTDGVKFIQLIYNSPLQFNFAIAVEFWLNDCICNSKWNNLFWTNPFSIFGMNGVILRKIVFLVLLECLLAQVSFLSVFHIFHSITRQPQGQYKHCSDLLPSQSDLQEIRLF